MPLTRRVPWLIFAVALLVRLIVLIELRGTLLHQILVSDAKIFDEWGRRIAGGDWIGKEVFYQAPLYAYFLGAIYSLGGDLLAARITQAVLGALSAVLVAAASSQLFGRRVGLLAGLFYALYAPVIWLEGLIQKSALDLFLTSLVFFVFTRILATQRWRWAVSLGAALGCLTLVRENASVLLVPFALFFAVRRERWKLLGVFLASFALILLPIGIRNAVVGDVFLPTASNFGVNFYIGNSAGADGMYRPLDAGRGHPEFEFADAKRLAEDEEGRELSSAAVSLHWLRRGWSEVARDPAHWFRLLGKKALLLFHRTEIMDAESFELYADHSRILAWLGAWAHFGSLFPLAAVGLFCAWKVRARLWPVMLAILCLAASIVLFFVVARFRSGLIPFLAPFAAFGLVELVDRLRSRERRRSVIAPVLVLAGAGWLANRPTDQPGDPRATARGNLASELLRRGDFERALEQAEGALKHDPANPEALFNLGVAAKELGRLDLAEQSLRRSAELEPAFAGDAARLIGQIRAARGDPTGALAYLREAVRLEPEKPEAHYDLGYLHETQGLFAEAAEHYRSALAIDPSYALAREGLTRIATDKP